MVHVLSGSEYDVYIGRAMPRYGLERSKWANPVKVKDAGREWALLWYERMIREVPGYAEDLHEIRGKALGCWCSPKDRALTLDDPEVCHGQVLLRLAEELAGAEPEDAGTEGKRYVDHPQLFLCRCGARHLARRTRFVSDDLTEIRDTWEFSDFFAPDKPISRCYVCRRELAEAWYEAGRR